MTCHMPAEPIISPASNTAYSTVARPSSSLINIPNRGRICIVDHHLHHLHPSPALPRAGGWPSSCDPLMILLKKKGETDRTGSKQLSSLLRPVSPIQIRLAAIGFLLNSDSSYRREDTRGLIGCFSYSILFCLSYQLRTCFGAQLSGC